MNKEEIKAMAAAVDIEDVDEFEKLYVRKIGIRKSRSKMIPFFESIL